MKSLLSASVQGPQYFGLWRAQRQGLYGQVVHPDQRVYEVPTEEQKQVEIELLRTGLQPVVLPKAGATATGLETE